MHIHYIKVNNGIVVDGYADWEEHKRHEGEIQLPGVHDRHFTEDLVNIRGQYRYKYENESMILRPQSELDEEWSNRPASPTKEELLQQQIDEMKVTLGDFILFGGV